MVFWNDQEVLITKNIICAVSFNELDILVLHRKNYLKPDQGLGSGDKKSPDYNSKLSTRI